MELEDIKDVRSLEDWLRARPKDVAQGEASILAARAALRALPIWSGAMRERWAGNAGLTALTVLRLHLAAGVARKFPSNDMREAAASADARAFEAGAAADISAPNYSPLDSAEEKRNAHITSGAATSALHAARAALVGDIGAAVAAADRAILVHFDVSFYFWRNVQFDARLVAHGLDIEARPLWPDTAPEGVVDRDQTVRANWSRNPQTWSFWLRWWEGVLSGNHLDWELQREVALIPDAIWQQGPEAVAAAIDKIELRHRIDLTIRQNPYAWRITFDRRHQTFEAQAVEARDLSQVVGASRDLIKEFHKRCRKLSIGNFGLAVELAFEPVINILRRDLKRHETSPLSLFKAIEAARREMQEIAEKERFAGESYLTRFFLGLQDCAEDICVAAPEIVEQLKAKEAVRYELYSMEHRRATMLQVFGLHLDAEGMLKRVALESLRVLGDENASDAEKKEAWYFASAVLPRAARVFLAETPEKDEPAPAPSKASLAKRVVDTADAIAKLDKGKDALLENVPALPDWIQSVADAIGRGGPISG